MPSSEQKSTISPIESLQRRIDWCELALIFLAGLSALVLIIATGFFTTWVIVHFTQDDELNIVLPAAVSLVAGVLILLTVSVACQRSSLLAKLTRLQIVEDLKNQGT